MKLSVLLTGVLASSMALAANTWWVDDDNYGKSGGGTSEADAFGTIQEAVNAAASGDTVKVLPGVYDKGETNDGSMMSRVVITEKLIYLVSTGGKDQTFIVGRHCTGSKPHDVTAADNDAVRCVYANYPGTEIRGFTLKNGDVKGDDASAAGSGAGLCAPSAQSVRLVDCNVFDCWGTRACGIYGGTAIRCLFSGCKTYTTKGAMGTIARNSILFRCIALSAETGGTDAIDNCRAVNCTFFGNSTGTMNGTGGYMINCVSVNNRSGRDPDTSDGTGNEDTLDLRHSVFGANNNIETTKYDYGLDGTVIGAPVRQFLAPAFGDFRPMSGTAAATNGLADIMFAYSDYKNAIPAADRYLDFFGKAVPETGTIPAGACQEVVAKPACGALIFDRTPVVTSAWGQIKVFGTPVVTSGFYAYPETYPQMMHLPREMFVNLTATPSTHLYAYRLGSDPNPYSWKNFRPPAMDDSFWTLPPPDPATDLRVSGVWANEQAYYVDPNTGDDTNNDGLSADTPFKSLKKTLDTVPADSGLYVIYAAAGTYDAANEGDPIAAGSHSNRVVTKANQYVRIKGAGRGKSIIKGAVHAGGQYGGCGPNAARCFFAADCCVLQGFTLADGFAGWNGSLDNIDLSRAGAVFLNTDYSFVSDCTITNCAAERGGGGNSGCYWRCKFEDCRGHNGGMRGITAWSSCSVVNCPGTNLGPFLYNDGVAVAVCQCSVYGVSATGDFKGGMPTWNCATRYGAVFAEQRTGKSVTLRYSMDGNVACNYQNVTATGSVSTEDPLFASSTDLRPLAGSPLYTAGARPDSDVLKNYSYHLYATTDVDGRPLMFNEKGRPTVGCYQTAGLNGLRIVTPKRGTISPSGTLTLEPGESVTVTYTPDQAHAATRPYLGIAVNGEIVTAGTSWTVTAPAAGEPPLTFTVEALASTNWYVNANAATDDGDGFTPETAKRRLCDIMACDLLAGDVIHAAPGDYKDGEMAARSGYTTPCRVQIPSEITLVADQGPEVTIIRGKKGSGDPYGGAGSVRCVHMLEKSCLRGFTVTDGNTVGTSGSDFDAHAGGIYADDKTSIVYGCIVTNCASYRAGGVSSGTIINTRIVQNYAGGGTYGAAGANCNLIGCYIDGQKGVDKAGGVRNPTQLDGCTLVDSSAEYGASCATINNCVFKNVRNYIGDKKYHNCVFDEVSWNKAATKEPKTDYYDAACKKVADLMIDANGRPLAGSPVINAGTNVYVSAQQEGLDAVGNPRISNITVDAGAFEYDWRPEIAAALGVGVTVSSANAAVGLEDGKVKLLDGGKLSGTWPALYAPAVTIYSLTAETSGEGQLDGALVSDDETIDESLRLTAGASEVRTFRVRGADIDFAFSFTQGGAGFLSAFTQTPPPGLMILIR